MITRGETDHMEIALDTVSKEIYVTQRWKLNFIDDIVYPWTPEEKQYYRQEVKKNIYECWDSQAYAIVNSQRGSSFNREYGKIPFLIRIKLEFVETGQHWTVDIQKRATRERGDTTTNWLSRVIRISNLSIAPYRIQKGQWMREAVVHEFGHALGNTKHIGDINAGDEYIMGHPLFGDKKSIMNRGKELRHRHFAHVRDILQKMFPNSFFCIRLR